MIQVLRERLAGSWTPKGVNQASRREQRSATNVEVKKLDVEERVELPPAIGAGAGASSEAGPGAIASTEFGGESEVGGAGGDGLVLVLGDGKRGVMSGDRPGGGIVPTTGSGVTAGEAEMVGMISEEDVAKFVVEMARQIIRKSWKRIIVFPAQQNFGSEREGEREMLGASL
ncbi:unnamed protein product [Victoria cruziana]